MKNVNKKSIFIGLRYGHRNLDFASRRRLVYVAEKIKKLAIDVGKLPIVFVGSPAPIAEPSARLLTDELGIPSKLIVFDKALLDEGRFFSNRAKTREILTESMQTSCILLMFASGSLVKDMSAFISREFRHIRNFTVPECEKGYLVYKKGSYSFPQT